MARDVVLAPPAVDPRRTADQHQQNGHQQARPAHDRIVHGVEPGRAGGDRLKQRRPDPLARGQAPVLGAELKHKKKNTAGNTSRQAVTVSTILVCSR